MRPGNTCVLSTTVRCGSQRRSRENGRAVGVEVGLGGADVGDAGNVVGVKVEVAVGGGLVASSVAVGIGGGLVNVGVTMDAAQPASSSAADSSGSKMRALASVRDPMADQRPALG